MFVSFLVFRLFLQTHTILYPSHSFPFYTVFLSTLPLPNSAGFELLCLCTAKPSPMTGGSRRCINPVIGLGDGYQRRIIRPKLGITAANKAILPQSCVLVFLPTPWGGGEPRQGFHISDQFFFLQVNAFVRLSGTLESITIHMRPD